MTDVQEFPEPTIITDEIELILAAMTDATLIPLDHERAGLARIWRQVMVEKVPFIIIPAERKAALAEVSDGNKEPKRLCTAALVKEISQVDLGSILLQGRYQNPTPDQFSAPGHESGIAGIEPLLLIPWKKEISKLKDEEQFRQFGFQLFSMTCSEDNRHTNANNTSPSPQVFVFGDSSGKLWLCSEAETLEITEVADIVLPVENLARICSIIMGSGFSLEGGYFPRGRSASLQMQRRRLTSFLSERMVIKTSDIAHALGRMDATKRPPEFSKKVIQRAGSLFKVAERRLKHVADVRKLHDSHLNQMVEGCDDSESIVLVDNGLFLNV